jgi:hypothetical protein
MRDINIDDLPEAIAHALEDTVRHLREQFAKGRQGPAAAQLPYWPGVALPPDALRRDEIYRDAG